MRVTSLMLFSCFKTRLHHLAEVVQIAFVNLAIGVAIKQMLGFSVVGATLVVALGLGRHEVCSCVVAPDVVGVGGFLDVHLAEFTPGAVHQRAQVADVDEQDLAAAIA